MTFLAVEHYNNNNNNLLGFILTIMAAVLFIILRHTVTAVVALRSRLGRARRRYAWVARLIHGSEVIKANARGTSQVCRTMNGGASMYLLQCSSSANTRSAVGRLVCV